MRYLAMAVARTGPFRARSRLPEVADDDLCQDVPLRRARTATPPGPRLDRAEEAPPGPCPVR